MKSNNEGFTFIELTVVLVIVGLLAGLAVPRFSGVLEGYRLRSAAFQLAADIRYVQQRAVYGNGEFFKLWLIRDENLYRIGEGVKILETKTFPPGITISEINLNTIPLTFSLLGAPSSAGYISLINPQGDNYYIIIMGSTGRVRVATLPPDTK